jgi:hypothetical protein
LIVFKLDKNEHFKYYQDSLVFSISSIEKKIQKSKVFNVSNSFICWELT